MLNVDGIVWNFLISFVNGKVQDVQGGLEQMLQDVSVIIDGLTDKDRTWWDEGMLQVCDKVQYSPLVQRSSQLLPKQPPSGRSGLKQKPRPRMQR